MEDKELIQVTLGSYFSLVSKKTDMGRVEHIAESIGFIDEAKEYAGFMSNEPE